MKADSGYFVSENLAVGYRSIPLIREISLQVKRGEILTLIGPNGSGNSTILKTITRQLAAVSGAAYLGGEDLWRMPPKTLAQRQSVVLTERVRPELMTCWELVATARYPYTGRFGRLEARDRAAVEAALQRVQGLELAERLVAELSDGQFQRVMLARAICQEPEMIVLDEPTSFLDIRHKLEILGILQKMAREEGVAVVMSLHEVDLAAKVSDRVVCVKGETIAACGPPEKIFSNQVIAKLYGIEAGQYDCRLGTVELAKPAGAPMALVVGGNGTGIPFYRALQRLGLPFAAGILWKNDIEAPVAEALAARVFWAEAFLPPEPEVHASSLKFLEKCALVADSGCPKVGLNEANAQLLWQAREKGVAVARSVEELAGLLGR